MGYGPPKLGAADLSPLVELVGGDRPARRLLDIAERTLQHWRRSERVPLMALRLLWYASPYGREDAAAHAEHELLLTQALARALREQVEALQAQLDAALGARRDGAANDPVQPLQQATIERVAARNARGAALAPQQRGQPADASVDLVARQVGTLGLRVDRHRP